MKLVVFSDDDCSKALVNYSYVHTPSEEQNKEKEGLQASLMMQAYTSYSNAATNNR